MNPLKSFGLNGHREFQTGDIYVRQSKAEQWLRLISILMNANWHICYGGLAVQTLQLAWLINYPPAGGSLEMEAGEWAGGVWMGGIKEERWKNMRKKQAENCLKPPFSECDFLFITLWEWRNSGESFYSKKASFLQTFLKNERFKLHLKKLWFLSLNDFFLTEWNISKELIRDQRDQIRCSD